jgi:TRAP transporter 4TM/12TM fusion protein
VGGFSGGPAKVAVVASALEGMVSGSSVANTVGSGSVTIPLMKKTGYKPEFAAAAEAAASTGGQIMPPIMGAAAFLMADYVQLPYGQIALKAILPAVLYFAGIFVSVHLEAKKLGLRGLTKEELPRLKPLLKKVYLLLPLVLLVYLVGTSQRSIQYAADIAIVVAIEVSMFDKKTRITPMRLLEALAAGGQGTITVAAACGIAGIIAGTITMTGLANMMINGIVALAVEEVQGAVLVPGKKRGISLYFEKDGVYADISVIVKYGFNVPELAYRIQQSVKQSVENMTKYKIVKVDVHVQDVVFENGASALPAPTETQEKPEQEKEEA